MKILKLIGQIVGAIGAVSVIGAAAIYAYQFRESQDEILETVQHNNIEIGDLSERVWNLHDTAVRIEDKIDQNTADDQQFRRAWRFEQQNRDRYTKGQLDTILTELLKKNGNLIVSSETPSTGPD